MYDITSRLSGQTKASCVLAEKSCYCCLRIVWMWFLINFTVYEKSTRGIFLVIITTAGHKMDGM